MTGAKALERYMCPSEISGYRKKGAPPPPPAMSFYEQQQRAAAATTRALHMHALDSHSLPKILVLHLKRFERHDGGGSHGFSAAHLSKSSKHVQFHRRLVLPPRYLGTAAAASSPQSSGVAAGVGVGVEYELRAVVVHHGASMQGGHYTAFVRDSAAERELQLQQQQQQQQSSAPSPPAAQKIAAASNNRSGAKQAGKKSKHARPSLPSSDDEEADGHGSDAEERNNRDAAASTAAEVWLHCDDARISPVAAHTVYAQQAYLLFYTLVEA
jgi:hypothetical protein